MMLYFSKRHLVVLAKFIDKSWRDEIPSGQAWQSWRTNLLLYAKTACRPQNTLCVNALLSIVLSASLSIMLGSTNTKVSVSRWSHHWWHIMAEVQYILKTFRVLPGGRDLSGSSYPRYRMSGFFNRAFSKVPLAIAVAYKPWPWRHMLEKRLVFWCSSKVSF